MFKPSYNIKYALKHLKWMKKSLYHPLFIAYAYNGGMGFFKKHLKTGAFTKGKYEPFLSMELMSNKESREYGKKVLSNYVMYKKILGEEVSITKSLATYIRADIRSLTHELKESVKVIEEKDEKKQKELEGKIDSLQSRLEEVLGEYEKLLDVHTEKLLTLQAEVMTLRETVLKDFGEVFTKLEILMYKERIGGEGNE